MIYVVGALEVTVEHPRIIGVDAQLLVQQTLQILGSFCAVHDRRVLG